MSILRNGGSEIDFATRFLRGICGFIGFGDVPVVAVGQPRAGAEQAIARVRENINAAIAMSA